MQRFNTFNMIHKALRVLMYDTATTLQQTYFGDEQEALLALSRVEDVIHQFDQHAHHEDHFILPAVTPFAPGVSQEFEKEHVEDIRLGNDLIHLINITRAVDNAIDRIAAGSAITKSFIDFMTFNLKHMAKEEIIINKVLWENYSDEQIMELNLQIIASIPAEEMAVTTKWMMRGINKKDGIKWFQTVRDTAPESVFSSLLHQSNAEMPKTIRDAVHKAIVNNAPVNLN